MQQQKQAFPPQHQNVQPGIEAIMEPKPIEEVSQYRGSGKLQGKVALITGGDSGIGRSVAIHYAKEGADVAVVYLNEHEDAQQTKRMVEQEGRRCITIAGDIGDASFCHQAVQQTVNDLGKLDVLVNHAGEQHVKSGVEEITSEQMERTFRTNIYGFFYMTQAALPHMKPGSAIVNTTSVNAYQANPSLLDYAATKGAIVTFTRGLANQLVQRGIRVNAVAPGPVWTPLIPASFPAEVVAHFGQNTPLGRAAQPYEMAPSYVFLASEIDSSYMTGQVLHLDAGETTCS